jgi:hypothetical protein
MQDDTPDQPDKEKSVSGQVDATVTGGRTPRESCLARTETFVVLGDREGRDAGRHGRSTGQRKERTSAGWRYSHWCGMTQREFLFTKDCNVCRVRRP